MTIDRTKLRWNGWGWAERAEDSEDNDGLWRWLAEELGMGALMSTPALDLGNVDIPDPRLPRRLIELLEQTVGSGQVRADRYERAFHARGKSYFDLLHLRNGMLDTVPDVVVYPETALQVLEVLAFALEHSLSVVPFGGGTSVVGGVTAVAADGHQGVISLDMTRMNRVRAIDSRAMQAVAEAGIHGPDLERQLQQRGYTLGHHPQSFEFSTLGGWIAARGAGQQSNRYGKAEDWLVSAKLVTPRGYWTTECHPASAAGPDLNQMVAGSEGRFGVITEAVVKIHPVPEATDYRGFLFRNFESGMEAVRAVSQSGVPVAMLRLSDADETRYFQEFARRRHPSTLSRLTAERAKQAYLRARKFDGPACLLLTGAEGAKRQVSWAVGEIGRIVRQHDGMPVGRSAGKRWYAGRFEAPYLRDVMLDHGVGVDTVETATRWSNIPHLHRVLRETLAKAIAESAPAPGARGIVLGHISHTYRDGASLYFTFIF
ncbi:MAG: FAD-binding oxidoreductase, partial [Alphaproteobacteria bacterium]